MSRASSNKTTDLLSLLDNLEFRPGVLRLCGGLALALLGFSFAVDLVLVMDFSRPYQIAQFSQDEYWFLEEIVRLQNMLLALDWSGVRAFGSPFAYGFAFWLFTALIAMPLHGHIMLMALFLRLVFMATKYAAFYVVYRCIRDLTHKPLFSLLFLSLLLIVPAFVFDGKIISPEYLIMLLVAFGWSLQFSPDTRNQMWSAFCFVLAATIKINMAPLGLLFPAVWLAQARRERTRLISYWVLGAIVPVLLFFFPEHPLKEILAIGQTHHVDWGLEYLYVWYAYNALEFDDMLKGGWSVDFIAWPLFVVFLGYAIYQDVKVRANELAWPPHFMTVVVWTFYAGVLTCFLTSLTSLMHPWFVFAPFLLLMAAGSLLIAAGRMGTTVMFGFFLVYGVFFAGRDLVRWQHRIDKFEAVAASEELDAGVATWISENCPNAREAVIDYNLLWPQMYNGHMKRTWTLIDIEDYRRFYGDASGLINNIDLLLLKRERVVGLFPPNGPGPGVRAPGAILGNFFPATGPYFGRIHDFPDLSIFARDGVCKK